MLQTTKAINMQQTTKAIIGLIGNQECCDAAESILLNLCECTVVTLAEYDYYDRVTRDNLRYTALFNELKKHNSVTPLVVKVKTTIECQLLRYHNAMIISYVGYSKFPMIYYYKHSMHVGFMPDYEINTVRNAHEMLLQLESCMMKSNMSSHVVSVRKNRQQTNAMHNVTQTRELLIVIFVFLCSALITVGFYMVNLQGDRYTIITLLGISLCAILYRIKQYYDPKFVSSMINDKLDII